MYDLPRKTISSKMINPIFNQYSFADVPMSKIIKALGDFEKNFSKLACPEEDALMFYLSNYGIHLVQSSYHPLEILPDNASKFLDKCLQITSESTQRLFYHLLSVGNGMLWIGGSSLEQKEKNFFESTYGSGFMDYLNAKSGHSMQGPNGLGKYSMTVGEYFGGISYLYGIGRLIAWGKPYSMIMKTALSATKGRDSLHTMADHTWSLCHNGGTVLNKGIGNMYSVASTYLFDILDVQDSGQIPQWIAENKNNKYVTAKVKSLYDDLIKAFPQEKEKKLDKPLLNKSIKKRKDAHEQMKKQYQQWWTNNGLGGGVPPGGNDTPKEAPVQKIDKDLIDTFKGRNWI